MTAIKAGRYLTVDQAAGFRVPTGHRPRRIEPASPRAYLARCGLATLALDIALHTAEGRAAS